MERVHVVTSHVQAGVTAGGNGEGPFEIVDGDFDGIPVRDDLQLRLTHQCRISVAFFAR